MENPAVGIAYQIVAAIVVIITFFLIASDRGIIKGLIFGIPLGILIASVWPCSVPTVLFLIWLSEIVQQSGGPPSDVGRYYK